MVDTTSEMSLTYLNDLNLEQTKLAPKSGGKLLPHNCITRLNLYKVEDEVEFSEFPLKCGYPQPIHMEKEEHTSLFNHPQILVRQKHNYKERLSQLKRKIMGKRKNKKFEAETGIAAYGGNFPLFVELLKEDPDKYFDGPYDWYYTGGSLTLSTENNCSEIFLLSVTGKYLDRLRVSQQSNTRTKLIDLSKNNSIIYETDKYGSYYMVRQKNHITGFCHDDDTPDLLDLTKKFTINSKVPYLSSAFVSDSKIATIDANQTIKYWDIQTVCAELSKKIETNRKIDNWGYLKKCIEPLVLHAHRSGLNVLDFRVPNFQTIGTYVYENSYECNKIYGMANSKFENLVYISTNHAIYGLDIRYLSDNLSMNTVNKWTHLMKLPPIMIDTVLYNSDEYIYLSSSLRDSQKICVNRKNSVYSSPYLPYKPKNMGDTYRQIRLQGKCVDPISDFGERINICPTGICIFVKNEILHTIVSNASGDIFYQKFEDNDHGVPADTIQNMEKWVNLLRNTQCSKITNMDNMSSVLLAMQCKKLSLPTDSSNPIDENFIPRKPKWQRNINDLYQYKDVLAKNILDAWDISVSPVGNDYIVDSQLSQLGSSELPYSSKVGEWLTRNDDIDSIISPLVNDDDVMPNSEDITNQVMPDVATSQLRVEIEKLDMSLIFKTKRNDTRRKSARLEGF